jgi:Cu/Ag efflux pump CusA
LGEKVSEIYEGSKTFDLMLRFDEVNKGKIINIKNTFGQYIRWVKKYTLYYVADIVSTSGPNTINRENNAT